MTKTIVNLSKYCNTREAIIQLFHDFLIIASEAKQRVKESKWHLKLEQ